MSRYDDREYYAGPPQGGLPVRVRERDDYDVEYRRGESERGYRPEFLQDDYGRNAAAGPVVLRERDTETFVRQRPRSPSIHERYTQRSPTPPSDFSRTRIVERERHRSPSPQLRARVTETRERIRERSPSPVRIVRERFVERERSPSPVDRVRIRNIERQVVRQPSPSPSPPPPPPIQAPTIHQEVVTHHRHIDHGFERARVPTPPPPPRQSRTKETDIDIYTSRNHTDVDITRRTSDTRARTPQPFSNSMVRREREHFHDDSYIYEQERNRLRVSDNRVELSRRRSISARPEQRDRSRVRVGIRDNENESEFYARKTNDRAYIGEAYNGATKNWSIIDVPPGTERVRMDGVGGGSQEISWQKYNGVRRSRFIPEREREGVRESVRDRIEGRDEGTTRETSTLEIDISSRRRGGGSYEREYERIEENSDRRVGLPRGPPKARNSDLWTEITKDLVTREAIEELGYDFEETEFFYYIIQYLRYEDVLELVQLSEVIRRERQQRIREIERERARMERADRRRERDYGFRGGGGGGRGGYDDERIVEREVIYSDGRRTSRRGGGW